MTGDLLKPLRIALLRCRDSADLADLRNRILPMFFKNLASPCEEIVQIAKEGLRHSVANDTIPRDLLQACLRPILFNLAHHTKLNLPMLKSMVHLLELLAASFAPVLGKLPCMEGRLVTPCAGVRARACSARCLP
jgi:hypothetical protein